MNTQILQAPGTLLPILALLGLAVLIVGGSFLYWVFTCGANDKLIAKTNRELGKAEGYLQCIAENYDLSPKVAGLNAGKGGRS